MRISRFRIPALVAATLLLLGAAFSAGLAFAQGSGQSGTTSSNDCSSGVAVPDPAENPGLVSDCDALLAARDTLAGSGSLNWSPDVPMAEWNGVVVSGDPRRVVWIDLQRFNLNGSIPTRIEPVSLSCNTCTWPGTG